jgi:hypothetical protein
VTVLCRTDARQSCTEGWTSRKPHYLCIAEDTSRNRDERSCDCQKSGRDGVDKYEPVSWRNGIRVAEASRTVKFPCKPSVDEVLEMVLSLPLDFALSLSSRSSGNLPCATMPSPGCSPGVRVSERRRAISPLCGGRLQGCWELGSRVSPIALGLTGRTQFGRCDRGVTQKPS